MVEHRGVRVLTLNLVAQHGDWPPARREALRTGLRQLRPDVVALQEAVTVDAYDSAVNVLSPSPSGAFSCWLTCPA